MKDLHSIGLRGRLPNFISNFLSDRSFNVRIGSTLSDTFEQEQGVPQGSILSPTLFNIKINNIVKCVNDTDSSLYIRYLIYYIYIFISSFTYKSYIGYILIDI